MERFDLDVEESVVVDTESRGRGAPAGKRRWREIETLKEKFRLKKELQEIDIGFDVLAGDLDF
ncbi:DUF3545 family protein [Pseudaeromonas paramecii]|uniref:DUF3545 domain-containing protein n=1 Tax=Pseudaeromonas paramecii TaxID=2138166 RepID=A0ABP8QGF4_9GAMM